MDVVASLFQGRTAAAQCGLFTYKSVPVIFEPPCITQEIVVIPYRRFGITYRSNLQGRGFLKGPGFLTLEDGTDGLSRNVGKELPLLAA